MQVQPMAVCGPQHESRGEGRIAQGIREKGHLQR